MGKKKILYISGSIGMGHISKDLAVVDALRVQNPGVEIIWLAPHPANRVLQHKGENLHPDSARFANYSELAENAAKGNRLNLVQYVLRSTSGWWRNVQIFKKILVQENFDLVVGNETYEIMIGLIFKLIKIKIPFIIIYDFLGLDAMAGNLFEKTGAWLLNWTWAQDHRVCAADDREVLFVGEPEDVPDRRLGFLLPNRRQYARDNYHFIGYIIRFDPGEYADRMRVRKSLGYGKEPLIVCSIGGTSIGLKLLELCNQTYPIIKKAITGLRMVLVTGPRLSPESVKVHPGVEVRGYVPDLYKHYAASDLAIVQGGFSSTMELTALRRPFLFFPIEGHSEQDCVAERLARYNAGVRMRFSETTPELLAQQVVNNLGKSVSFRPVLTNGAERAAKAINRYL